MQHHDRQPPLRTTKQSIMRKQSPSQNASSQRVPGRGSSHTQSQKPQTTMSQEYIKDLVNEVETIVHKKLNNDHKLAMLHSTPPSHAKNNITAFRLFVLNNGQGQHTGKNRNKLWTELQNLVNNPKDRATLKRQMMENPVNKLLLASDIMPSQWHEVLQDV